MSKLHLETEHLYPTKEGTIGDASTSEGLFFECVNAAAVLQVPMVLSVWDDGYGISVSAEHHTVQQSISSALQGFQRNKKQPGLEIFCVKGWEYSNLLTTYKKAEKLAREQHVPVLIHVQELTQPQGHSTSGSHTRYKSNERLQWEETYDCLVQMRGWLRMQGALANQLDEIEQSAKEQVKIARNDAWKAFKKTLETEAKQSLQQLDQLQQHVPKATSDTLKKLHIELSALQPPIVSERMRILKKALYTTRTCPTDARQTLQKYVQQQQLAFQKRYSSHLYSQSHKSVHTIQEEQPHYTPDGPSVDGREILQACFDHLLAREPRFFIIGEDVGRIGDVNQGLAGLQEKYGPWRVTDTGIREASIIGQGIGAALRGLRPITEIQYLDYVLYALQTLSDDLATLHYRSGGTQKAPLIIRTRGHRLEGVWHSGSPMGVLLHALRGMHILVPRDMTRAAAFYNTLLASDEPAILIECLNGYRLKERMPTNIGTMKIELGKPEILRPGADVTLLTYGSMCRIAMDACQQLDRMNVSVELIDLQTLLPFDRHGMIQTSLAKTHRLLIADEDVPGGASAYILQQVLDAQSGYYHLDAPPRTLTAQPHRPAYGSDGDYFSKPNVEDLIETAYALVAEDASPRTHPPLYT